MKTALPVRRGYAMVIVVMFIVLFTALLGVVFRELAGTLRMETMHKLEVQRDTGSIAALAQALALLQTGTPPTNPYVYSTTVGAQNFSVTFTLSADGTTWTVQVSPAASGGTPPPPFDPHGFDWVPPS